MSDEYVRVLFKLEKDEEDHPPVDYERLWAKRLEEGLYEIDNIPFFVSDISVGDVVSTRAGEGEAVFCELVRESGNSTLRVIVFDEVRVQDVRHRLQELGCSTELNVSKMLGVNVPAQVDIRTVRGWLMAPQSPAVLAIADA